VGGVDLDVDMVVDLDGDGNVEVAGNRCRRRLARGEAMECAASLDVMRLRKLIDDARYARGIKLIEGVVAMLTKMI
jgi:hypothetical protein